VKPIRNCDTQERCRRGPKTSTELSYRGNLEIRAPRSPRILADRDQHRGEQARCIVETCREPVPLTSAQRWRDQRVIIEGVERSEWEGRIYRERIRKTSLARLNLNNKIQRRETLRKGKTPLGKTSRWIGHPLRQATMGQ
jgi:hypothetical protein